MKFNLNDFHKCCNETKEIIMGLLACYHAIAHCDSCGREIADIGQVETKQEVFNILRDAGCLFTQVKTEGGGRYDAVIICPTCFPTKFVLLPKENRAGGPWNDSWPRYRKKFTNKQLKAKGLLLEAWAGSDES
jgi:hypothetical protein